MYIKVILTKYASQLNCYQLRYMDIWGGGGDFFKLKVIFPVNIFKFMLINAFAINCSRTVPFQVVILKTQRLYNGTSNYGHSN
jgi:hypothetical protein